MVYISSRVQDEIEVLEKRLQALRARRSELVDGIADQDREIALARGSFEEEEAAMKGVKDDLAKQQEELKQRQVREQLLLHLVDAPASSHTGRRLLVECVHACMEHKMCHTLGDTLWATLHV